MKNNIVKMLIGLAVLGAGGLLYWYYDSSGDLGAGIHNDAVVVDAFPDSSSSVADLPTDDSYTQDNSQTPTKTSQAKKVDIVSDTTTVTPPVESSPHDDAPPVDAVSDNITTSTTDEASDVPIISVTTSTAPATSPHVCSFVDSANNVAGGVILNEIAWMGSIPTTGETSAKASKQEWIELKNTSSTAIDLSGWQIVNAAGSLKITIGVTSSSTNTDVPPGGFYLLVRGGAPLGNRTADSGYSGTLANTGDKLELFDANCDISDSLDASDGWPGGNNTTKQTLERDVNDSGWHTSSAPGGTPHAENSVPIPTWTLAQDVVSVSMTGNGLGTVSSSPSGILCGFDCKATYSAGTEITFAATPNEGSVFKAWSGACSGTEACSMTISSSIALVADFEALPPAQTPSDVQPTVETDVSSTMQSVSSSSHLLVAQVQIAGGASSNDFVKLFNPTDAAVDLGGWKLHKKSSTGTDSSLKTFASGSMIPADGYFTWANSTGGFADSIDADASSTETLSADNSVALFDANGNIVDQVGWGTGANQYREGAIYPTDPTSGQVLTRKIQGGAMVDTDDNASDFAIP